jgi:hypothetical protein
MKKSNLAIIGLAVIVISIVVISSPKDNKPDPDSDYVYHVNLSELKYVENETYEELFEIGNENCQRYCDYNFRFVPNGDSPQTLSISITGDNTFFSEDFELVGTLVETDISQYYTWDYRGQKHFEISGIEKVKMIIDPYGNVMGTVSVYIIQE